MDKKVRSIRPIIASMEVGQEIEFPVERFRTVRTTSCDLGLIHNRRYVTTVDRDARVIKVKRLT